MTHRNAFAAWLLIGLTAGIYAFVLYERLNRELAAALSYGYEHTGEPLRPAWSRWWSQLVPFYGIVGLHRTAKRLNEYALARHVPAPNAVVSPTATWLFWSWFFVGSYAYLQAGANKAAR